MGIDIITLGIISDRLLIKNLSFFITLKRDQIFGLLLNSENIEVSSSSFVNPGFSWQSTRKHPDCLMLSIIKI